MMLKRKGYERRRGQLTVAIPQTSEVASLLERKLIIEQPVVQTAKL
jgi:hypothetical protein